MQFDRTGRRGVTRIGNAVRGQWSCLPRTMTTRAACMGSILRHFGYQVEEASNGVDAVELARTGAPNLVLMDIGLPRTGRVAGEPDPEVRPAHARHSTRSRSPRASTRPPISSANALVRRIHPQAGQSVGSGATGRRLSTRWSRRPMTRGVRRRRYTASDKLVKLKSRTLSAGITTSPPASVPATRSARPIRLEIVQHEQRRLVESHVLHRLRDLSVLDEERSVAREPGVEHRARIDLAQIPEPRDEHAARRRPDEIFGRLRAADELHRVRARVGLLVLLLRPEARIREPLEHAVLDPDLRGARQSLTVERVAQQLRIGRDRRTA